ncbi:MULTISPECIES: glutathione-dependent disulfide-bond oxidoreductase [Sphingobium]|uniref:glutathione-dependent disulfide-bond oxidoreductase n=1 Tax=Sphingobium TaxID=165695 RepID=UPI00159C4AD2|nr:glutathione-dependent disulfide-bond oxidoreductase [Sphingobium sp. 15-1]
MADDEYVPPAKWVWDSASSGTFNNINRFNRPFAGAISEASLPVGKHPLQLYSLASPNGQKVTILLEELLSLGISKAEYDAWLINIGEGDQFTSGFVAVNPNSKIPALVDRSSGKPVRIFESGAILLYLAEKFGAFIPADGPSRAECLSWLFWQVAAAPSLGGGFGHFYAYAPVKIEYAINRFALEVKRQTDVIDQRLGQNEYLAGADFTIADIAVWPWYNGLINGNIYEASGFLGMEEYRHVMRWCAQIAERPAVQRGCMVNRNFGDPSGQLHERHNASDFDTRTQDKIES